MKKVRFRPEARKDIWDSAVYLYVEANEAVAERFQDAVQNLAGTLAVMPGIWSAVSISQPWP